MKLDLGHAWPEKNILRESSQQDQGQKISEIKHICIFFKPTNIISRQIDYRNLYLLSPFQNL